MPRREEPKLHLFPELDEGEMYNRTQTDEEIKDGDLFVCSEGKTLGFLAEAWPVRLFSKDPAGWESLHTITAGHEARVEADYQKTFDLAKKEAAERGLL